MLGIGSYVPDPTDTTGYNSDKIGISFVTFDSTSGKSGSATPRIFVGVANLGSTNVFVSNDAGSTCKFSSLSNWMKFLNFFLGSAVVGQNSTYIPHKGVLSPTEKALYVSYSNGAGPYDGTLGASYTPHFSTEF